MLPQTQPLFPITDGKEVATFAGGCFWCTEALFLELRGVEKIASGYSGGQVENPSYKAVCSGATGHAEAIEILFDPKVIPYRDLVRIFLTTHDPTTLNRQGADVGTQYRSAIFTHSEEQSKTAQEVIQEITKEKVWANAIVTEVTPFANFYKAEEYHQNYFAQNSGAGYCQAVIAPKVVKLREKYREKLKR
jgi:peptide-methionine (S)-S-oxide reductase